MFQCYDKTLKAGQIYTWSKVNTKLGNYTRGQNYIGSWKAIYDVKTKFQAGHELMDACLYPGSKEDS